MQSVSFSRSQEGCLNDSYFNLKKIVEIVFSLEQHYSAYARCLWCISQPAVLRKKKKCYSVFPVQVDQNVLFLRLRNKNALHMKKDFPKVKQ